MQLLVPVASPATLRLLWMVQLAKGVFSLVWPLRLARDERVELVLLLVDGRSLAFAARVRACTPAHGAYHVDLLIDEIADEQRRSIERAARATA